MSSIVKQVFLKSETMYASISNCEKVVSIKFLLLLYELSEKHQDSYSFG